jgi:uncharacterized protein YjbI with pentapeptide repeats
MEDKDSRQPEVGKEDFRDQDLRGRSFKGQNLSGADFSHADVRGADFTKAILVGANFYRAKCGLQKTWVVLLVTIAVFLSALSGLVTSVAGFWITLQIIRNSDRLFISIVLFLVVLLSFSVAVTLRGVLTAIGILPAVMAVVIPIAGIVLQAGSGAPTAAGAGAGMAVVAGVGGIVVALLATGAAGVAGRVPTIVTIGAVGPAAVIAILIEKVAGTAAISAGTAVEETVSAALRMIVIMAATVILLASYVTWKAASGDKRFAFIQEFAVVFASLGGTSFRHANLTKANFSQARLRNTNFQQPTIAQTTRTCWFQSRELEWARVDGTILTNPDVRNLVVSRVGRGQKFIGLDLRGANLIEADLTGADLTEADISEATLFRACLEGADLTKTQAVKTDFELATLTGACLESWNIDSTTKLKEVICDYVYLLSYHRERRPSSGEFSTDEFTKLFQEVVSTVDLIFREGINWKAFIYSLKKLRVENGGTEISVRSIEEKGDGFVVVKVNVPDNANKAKIHSDLTQSYKAVFEDLKTGSTLGLIGGLEDFVVPQEIRSNLEKWFQSLEKGPTVIRKRVVLTLGQGDLNTGFSVVLQIGVEGAPFSHEFTGRLASAPELLTLYKQWQVFYRKSLRASFRLDVPDTQVTNVSRREFFQECYELETVLNFV